MAKTKKGRKNPLIPEMIQIGQRLAEAREAKKVTQEALAKKLGTSSQALGQVERGWRAPTVPWLARAAHFVGADLTWLLSGVTQDVRKMVDRLAKDRPSASPAKRSINAG